ncbi:MAG: PBP1A family penicillin-binding protein [Rhodobacteraceae bacterium]|nr:PBP1A family penicillin-binding protein [Paracoccaceae bacterium]
MGTAKSGKRPLRADRRYSGSRQAASGAKRKSGSGKPGGTARRSRRGGGGRRGGILGFAAGLIRLVMRAIWGVSWRLGVVGVLVLGFAVAAVYATLPPASTLVDGRARGSVTLIDDTGKPFAWRGDTFGGVITADTVSPYLKHAIIATEDRRFYHHFGVSPRGIASAIAINLREGRGALEGHGGSGITQQTAKLLCLGRPYDPKEWKSEADYEADCRRGSLGRKVREAVYALAMEAKYSKNEILTIYMNRAYLGAGTYGFEAASQRYFGKSAAAVDPSEAAMLAGLLVAPTRYAPTSDLERSRERAETIIGLMEQEHYLTPTEAAVARAHPAELSDAAAARAGGYFADWVMESTPSFLSSDTTEDVLIRTTYDKRIQEAAEDALHKVFDEKLRDGSKVEAAIVVMSADGAVRAMVGGRNTSASGQFNRATQALRQTGSAFKPFVYAAALDLGYTPDATVVDEPLTINVPGSGPWSPKNYNRKFAGRVTLTEALAESLNIPAVKVSEAVGRDNVRRIASDFGIKTELDTGPAVALGTSETTLLQMTAAYAGILNGGSSVIPYGVTELTLMGDSTPLMDQEGGIGERVITEHAARELVWMMHQVVETGTGRRARLGDRPAAGKTGTTSAARDAWFIGFTGDYVTGVWMGYDDNQKLTGTTGGGLPAEIWRETMLRVEDGLPVTPLPMDAPASLTAGTGSNDGTAGPGAALNQAAENVGNGVRRTGNAITNLLHSIFGG